MNESPEPLTPLVGSSNDAVSLMCALPRPLPNYSRLLARVTIADSFLKLLPALEGMPPTILASLPESRNIECVVVTNEAGETSYSERNHTLVAVVVPTFNSRKYVEQALDSIFMQRYRKMHTIIIDDSSSDGTEQIALDYMQRHSDRCSMSFLRLPHTGNPGVNRNVAMYNLLPQQAGFIGFIDSDDVYAAPNSVDQLVSAIEGDPDRFAALGDYDFISQSGERIHGPAGLRKSLRGSWKWRRDKVLSWENLAAGRIGVFHLQCLIAKTGTPFIPYRYRGEDEAYFCQLLKLSSQRYEGSLRGIVQVPFVAARYRKHAQSLTSGSQRDTPKLSQQEILPHHDGSIPLFYELAGVPHGMRRPSLVSEWHMRRNLRGAYRQWKAKRLQWWKPLTGITRRVRRRDVLLVPARILYFWARSFF